jgi:FkbM family methyltransferase
MAICEEFVKYKIYDLGLVSFSPDYSIDCGTYRGYFTFLMGEKFPTCKKICIEPHPENYRVLLHTISTNKLQNITTYNKALSTTPGKIALELWGSNMATNQLEKDSLYNVDVETLNLFSILNTIAHSSKLVIKVDIEGSELDFFPACIANLPNICAVYLETHDGWKSLGTIKEEFTKYGFSFSILRDRGQYIDSFAFRIY